ncbi:MAG: hypothetical protein ETSY1_10185 [Candidatus Entotheonella factor]|uniref:DUF642 domain-containing protein n=1 Tax=Entotheonella factor TaxID=1429438 RepID=W4LS32_ENTF1|nr:MAG: hypothetical protein ETSY1_10185 [Candidatus Entotheonella factor]
MRSYLVVLICLVAFALPARATQANLVLNGSFEDGVPPGNFITLGVGDTGLDHWEIVNGSIDYVGGTWLSSHGSRSLDMSGRGPGAISQSFTTEIGMQYEVRFDMAGNTGGGAPDKGLQVSTGEVPQAFAFDITGRSNLDMGWEEKVFVFTAVDTTTTLTFQSLTAGAFGPALDNVRVSLIECGQDLSISPTSLDFNQVAQNTLSAPQTITLINLGEAVLDLDRFILTGLEPTQFGLANDTCSGRALPPTEPCTINGIFAPTNEGLQIAIVRLLCGNRDSPTLEVELIGEGIAR